MKLNNKKIWILPAVVLFLLIILATAFYPAYNPQPEDIPLAIVNEDEGTELQGETLNIGNTMAENINDQDNEAVKWHVIDNEEELQEGLNHKEYVGAIIIDSSFSKNALSYGQDIFITQTQQEVQEMIESGEMSEEEVQAMQEQQPEMETVEPAQAELTIITNDGAFPQLSQQATQILNGIADGMNEQVSTQNINLLSENDIEVTGEQIEQLKQPVNVSTEKINEIGDHQANGNAQMVMFLPIWLSSMISAVLLFFSFRNKEELQNMSQKHKKAALLPCIAILASIVGGFGYVYYMDIVMNFNIPEPFMTALYISIAMLGFMSLLIGIMSWIGFATIPLFMLFVFFTMQAIMLPEPMIPQFYRDYIVPWNPFKYYMTTLQDLIYNQGSLSMDTTMWIFISFIVIGLTSTIIAIYVKNKTNQKHEMKS